jgi:predicted RNA-binding protein with TRAM domain
MPRFERRGFRKSFGPRIDIPKPVKVGEEYDVEINEMGTRGDGIARIKNFVVFVNGAKQGEKTHIKIKEVRNRFAIGEKVSAAEAPAVEEAAEVEESGEEE